MGRPDSVTTPGGQQTFQYDRLLRLKQRTAQGASTAYEYDNLSNLLTTTETHGITTYGYDWLSRLTSADYPTQAADAWTYDQVGNRLSSADVGDVIAHNERNELRMYGNLTFSYDAQGNQTERRENGAVAQRFIYDAENRLIRVEDGSGGVIARYEYDPFGRRLWKEVNGERTYFFYADEGLIAEFDENGKELRSYGYQPDSTWGTNPLWLKAGGKYYWYRNDHLGTPQTLVDSASTVVWQARYTAFGKADIQVETIENHLRFPGQYFDAETGLHYNFHRYYDPEIGRYTQVDPIGLAGGINSYAYVGMNPTGGIDPLGLWHAGAIADWYDEQVSISVAGLNELTADSLNPKVHLIAAELQVAMYMGGGLMDMLRLGEGMGEGGWGYVKDPIRAMVWAGAIAKVAQAAQGVTTTACGVAEAAESNYVQRFLQANPRFNKFIGKGLMEVHHRIPQIFYRNGIVNGDPHAVSNLYALPRDIHRTVVTPAWNTFRVQNPNATSAQIVEFAINMDRTIAPWINTIGR